jgi:hypothetical protein
MAPFKLTNTARSRALAQEERLVQSSSCAWELIMARIGTPHGLRVSLTTSTSIAMAGRGLNWRKLQNRLRDCARLVGRPARFATSNEQLDARFRFKCAP